MSNTAELNYLKGSLTSWLTTVDAKRIGVLYGVTAVVGAFLGGIEAMLIRTQLLTPNNDFLHPDTYNAMFTMHGITMIFLFFMPLNSAFFNFIMPLQIGARDVAFPRLNSLSYWLFLMGAVFFNIGLFTGDLPNIGWFGYAPLSTMYSGTGTDFWLYGLILLGVSSLIASINFTVTILNMRAPGMSLMRMPMFTWTTLIANVLLLLSLPFVTVGLLQIMFDRVFTTGIYDANVGGDVLLWQHLFWLFGHPEVYILILPTMGIVSEILPTFSRKPLFGYHGMVMALIALGFLGFGVWAHHMFTVGLGPLALGIFSALTMMIAIPTGIKIFNWITTMWGGSLQFTTAMLCGIGFLAMFTIGGVTGIMHASPPIDWQQHDSYFIVAHFHYILFGGGVFAFIGGIFYWFPKVTGKMLSEKIGKWIFWLFIIGFNLTFMPMHFAGIAGMIRRSYVYPADAGVVASNIASTIGAYITFVAALLFLYAILKALADKENVAVADPWDGRTLEWSVDSPPPIYNFKTIPTVRALDDFWYSKYGAKDYKPEQPGQVHLPYPSWWPLVVSAGLFFVAVGMVFGYVVSVIGLLMVIVASYGLALQKAE